MTEAKAEAAVTLIEDTAPTTAADHVIRTEANVVLREVIETPVRATVGTAAAVLWVTLAARGAILTKGVAVAVVKASAETNE